MMLVKTDCFHNKLGFTLVDVLFDDVIIFVTF